MINKIFVISLLIGIHLIIISCTKKEVVSNSKPDITFHSGLVNPSFEELQIFYEGGYNIISGDVEITDMYDLINMQALSNVDTIQGSLILRRNYDLLSLEGLNNLKYIGGDFIIDETQIVNLNGVKNLCKVGASIEITECRDLIFQDCLINLVDVGQNLYLINYCYGSFTGFDNLLQIGDSLALFGNRVTDIKAFKKLQSTPIFAGTLFSIINS